jgi:hypothetical protein
MEALNPKHNPRIGGVQAAAIVTSSWGSFVSSTQVARDVSWGGGGVEAN